MPRIARLVIKEEKAVYHVMSRTALDGYVLGDVEKDFLVNHIRWLAKVYFAEVLGFCIMGNHFHLLVRIEPGGEKSHAEIRKRFEIYYGEDDKRELTEELIPALREKWGSLAEFVKEIKQGFSRFYNRRHHRKGFFWSERFKSVIVDNGETLINCLAYIDLNPIRAGIVKKPEEYRWFSLGYHVQAKNRDQFLSTDFGLREFALEGEKVRLAHYRRFVYEKGGIGGEQKTPQLNTLEGNPVQRGREVRSQKSEEKYKELSQVDRFRYRTRYFTDSGIIGTKEFVSRVYQDFKGYFSSKHEKRPKLVQGLDGIYSLKRLSENIG
jgi:putative transposase